MKVASITEAKNTLSALLDRVRAGESVLIVDRGIPVARLEPVPAEVEGSDAARIARLERAGLVRRPSGPPPAALPVDELPQPRNRASVVEALLEERRSGR
jgi:prevent-host-death family protein